MQKTILMTAKLLIQQLFFSVGPNSSGYHYYIGNYIGVHHFISVLGEFMARIMGNRIQIVINAPHLMFL